MARAWGKMDGRPGVSIVTGRTGAVMTRSAVAYATKLGSTREIAEALAAELLAAGLDPDVQQVNDVRSLVGYDAVVLGSALYAAHWQRDANRFVQRHLEALQAVPVWLFSSGPLDSRLRSTSRSPSTRRRSPPRSAPAGTGRSAAASSPMPHRPAGARDAPDRRLPQLGRRPGLGPGDRGGPGVMTDREPLAVGSVRPPPAPARRVSSGGAR